MSKKTKGPAHPDRKRGEAKPDKNPITRFLSNIMERFRGR